MKIKLLLILSFLTFSCTHKYDSSKSGYVLNAGLTKKFENKDSLNDLILSLKNKEKSGKSVTFGRHQIASNFWTDENGNHVRQYSYTRKNTKFYEFIPILSYFLPKYYQNHEIIIVFNKKNRILDVDEFSDEISLKPRIFCGLSRKSCVNYIK